MSVDPNLLMQGIGYLISTVKSLGTLELRTELQTKLLDMQLQAGEIIDENRQLKLKNEELEAALARKGRVEEHHGVYWESREDGFLEGPFSPHHWDMSGKLVRLNYTGAYNHDGVPCHDFYCAAGKFKYILPFSFYETRKIRNADQLSSLPAPKPPRSPSGPGWMDGYR